MQNGFHNATVWGSGYLKDMSISKGYNILCRLRRFDIRCVRGPETRKVLLKQGYKCPEIYGDPAVLMPDIYIPDTKGINNKKEYCVVRNMHDMTPTDKNINILTTDYRGFIDKLVKHKLVISSSLHGIILAEAYGVPAVLYIPHGMEHTLNEFKYRDYYYSTNRYKFPVARTIEEALSLTPCEIPDFTDMRRQLVESFPEDLWKNVK